MNNFVPFTPKPMSENDLAQFMSENDAAGFTQTTGHQMPFQGQQYPFPQAPLQPAPTHTSSGPASAPLPAPAPASPTNMAAPGPVQQQPPAPALSSRTYDIGQPKKVGRRPAQDDPNLPAAEREKKARNRASQKKHREKKQTELEETKKIAREALAELEKSQALVAAQAQEIQLLKACLAEREAQQGQQGLYM